MRPSTSRSGFTMAWTAVLAAALAVSIAAGEDPSYYSKKGTWQETMLASRELLAEQAKEAGRGASLPDWGKSDFSVTAWIKTDANGGTIVAKAPAEGKWAPQGKVLFLRGGALAFDVGWVGAVGSDTKVNDGQWHHVALLGRDPLEFYVDGKRVKRGSLELKADPPGNVFKIGYCTPNFPGRRGFNGLIDEVRVYDRRLSEKEIGRLGDSTATKDKGLVAYYRFENEAADDSGNGNDGSVRGAASAEGKLGKALRFRGKDVVVLPASGGEAARNEIWALLARDFSDAKAQKEMARERQAGIWDKAWRAGDFAALAERYVEACADDDQKAKVAKVAEDAKSVRDLAKVSAAFHEPPPLRWPEATPLDTDAHLVGWWKFDEEAGTTAEDSSKKGHNGTLQEGFSFDKDAVRGRFGRALKFGGGAVEITGYKGVTGTGPRTVSAWIKTKESRGEIVSWGADEFGQMFIFGFVRGRVGLVPKGGYYYVRDPLHDDAWHHVAVVVVETDLPNLHDHVRLYQDGEPATIHDIGLLDLWPLETGAEQDVRIGHGFRGLIDDVRLYDRPLSEEQILTLFSVKTSSQK